MKNFSTVLLLGVVAYLVLQQSSSAPVQVPQEQPRENDPNNGRTSNPGDALRDAILAGMVQIASKAVSSAQTSVTGSMV